MSKSRFLCSYGAVITQYNFSDHEVRLGQNEQTLDEMIPVEKSRPQLFECRKANPAANSFEYFIGKDLRQLDLSELHFKDIQKKVSDQIEKKIISSVLEQTGWNRVKTAKLLNVSYRTVFNKMDELNIKPSMLI